MPHAASAARARRSRAATGQRYSLAINGVIYTGTGNVNFFPDRRRGLPEATGSICNLPLENRSRCNLLAWKRSQLVHGNDRKSFDFMPLKCRLI